MFVYIVPIFLVLFGAAHYDLRGRKGMGRTILYTFLFVYLILLIGLRYEVGGDTINYMGYYVWLDDLSKWKFTLADDRFGFQPLFLLLCAIGKSISPDFYVFQFIHIVLFNTLFFLFIFKFTPYRFWALFVSFVVCYLYFTTEILREVFSVMVFALNFKNFEERKWIRFYLGVFVALLFHMSAIFLIVLPFLRMLSLKNLKMLFLIGILVIVFVQVLFSYFSSFSLLRTKILYYSELNSLGYFVDTVRFLRNSAFPLFVCWLYRRYYQVPHRFENMVCIGALFGFCALANPIIFGRFVNYFVPFLVILMADMLGQGFRSVRAKMRDKAFVFLVALSVVYGSYYIHLDMYKLWIPYYSIFEPVHIDRDIFK